MQADVSEALQAKGIPGIKYFDQGSRAAGDGTRNMVLFDDLARRAKVLKRNDETIAQPSLFDTSRPLYRASNSKHDDFVTSIGDEHGVRGVSTTPDREYALTHGDVLEEVYGPKGEYIDAFELDDRYSHHLNEKYNLGLSAEDIDELSSSEIWIENVKGLKFAPSSEFNAASDQLDNDMADWAIDQGYVGSRFLDPQAGEDLRIFDPANIRRINETIAQPSVDEFIGKLLED